MSTVRDNPADSRYEILDGDDVAGIAEYTLTEGVIAFTHTETLAGHEGKGLAKQLVTAALAAARAQGLAVMPHCPYVRKVIADNPAEYLDLVPADARSEFGLPPA
jgi:predicted GNAT family acetyltransferase